jgi:hypothetical protein
MMAEQRVFSDEFCHFTLLIIVVLRMAVARNVLYRHLMKTSQALTILLVAATSTFATSAFATGLNCQDQVNEALVWLGQPAMSSSAYIARTDDRRWIQLSDLDAESLARQARERAAANQQQVRQEIWELMQKLSPDFEQRYLEVSGSAQMRTDGTFPKFSDILIKFNSEDLYRTVLDLAQFGRSSCRFRETETNEATTSAIAEARAACQATGCSVSVLAALDERERSVQASTLRMGSARTECENRNTMIDTFYRRNRKMAESLIRPRSPEIVPMVAFEKSQKAEQLLACMKKYETTEDSRRVEALTKMREKFSAACGESYSDQSSKCRAPIKTIEDQIRQIDVGSVCGREELSSRSSLIFYQPNFSIDLGRYPLAVFGNDNGRTGVQIEMTTCAFIGNARYDRSRQKYGSPVRFKTVKELALYNNECDQLGWFPKDYKQKACDDIKRRP